MADDKIVDVNTDDLDAFTELFNGKAKQAEPETVEDKVEDAVDDADATEEEIEEVTPEDESEEDDSSDEPEEDEEQEEAPKPKKKTVQERINELTRQAREAERRERDALDRLAKFAEPKPEDAPKPVETLAADIPSPDDLDSNGEPLYPLGEFDPNFITALTAHTIKAQFAEAEKQQAERLQKQQEEVAQTALNEQWNERLDIKAAEIEDFRPTIATLQEAFVNIDDNYGNYLANTIMSMEAGPEVLYYLAQNVDEAKKIVASGPTNATLSLGRLEAKLSQTAEKATIPVRETKAPTPPSTTRGTTRNSTIKDDTDDLDAFEAKFFSKK